MKRLLLTIYLLGAAFMAHASLIVVDSAQDTVANDGNCTLREALFAANFDIAVDQCAQGSGNDLIWLLTFSTNQALQITEVLPITDGVEIQGPGAENLTIFPGSNYAGSLFRINTNSDVSFKDFRLQGAQSSAIDVIDVSDLEFAGMMFVSNSAASDNNIGGAIHADTEIGSTQTIDSLTITDSEFAGNQATSGGAVAASGSHPFLVSNSLFRQNSATAQGSAIYRTYQNSSVAIVSLTTQIDDSVFTDNDSSALYFFYQTLNISESVFTENTGSFTISAINVRGEIKNSLFAGRESGTAILVRGLGGYSGSLFNLNFNTFLNERGPSGSGGLDLHVDNNSEVIIQGNAFAGNNAISCTELNQFTLLSDGYNLEAEGNTCNLNANNNDLPETDAMLLPLDLYGGDLLIAPPSPVSPLVDAGVGCDALDLSGEGRPRDGDASGRFGQCDIGAVERPDAYGLTLNYTGDGSGFAFIDELELVCDDFFFTSCFWPLPRNQTFVIQPFSNPGSTFIGWGGNCSGDMACQVTMSNFRTVDAEFGLVSSPVTLTVNKILAVPGLSATVTSAPAGINCGPQCSTDYMPGDVVSLSAEVDAGTAVDTWTGCDSISADETTCELTLGATDTDVSLFLIEDLDLVFENGFE